MPKYSISYSYATYQWAIYRDEELIGFAGSKEEAQRIVKEQKKEATMKGMHLFQLY